MRNIVGKSLIEELEAKCRVTDPQAGLQIEIGKNFVARVAEDQNDFTSEYIDQCFSILRDGGMLTSTQGTNMLKFVRDPKSQEYFRLFVTRHKDMFARIIHDVKLDPENLNLIIIESEHLFFENGSYIGTKKVEQYVVEHTEGVVKTPEATNSTPELVKNFRDGWVNGMKIGNKETRESHKAKLDQLVDNGGVGFENYKGFDDVCHINIPGFDGRFYAPKTTPSKETRNYYNSTNYTEGGLGAWDNSNNRNDTYLEGMRDGKGINLSDENDGWERRPVALDVAPYFLAGLQMASRTKLQSCCTALGEYLGTDSLAEQISAWMYLTGNYGWYWLSDCNDSFRDALYAHDNGCWFSDSWSAGDGCGALFSD